MKRLVVIALVLSIVIVPGASTGGPLAAKGVAQGYWCFAEWPGQDCFRGSQDTFYFWLSMQGTWSYEGKTIRVVGHTGGTGQNLGNGTARLSQPFVLHIHEARTDQRILIGSCTGEAKTGAVVAIDAMCSYYTNDFQDTGITAPISFRLVDERLVHYPVYTAYETALGGPACSGGMPCPAPVDGIYF